MWSTLRDLPGVDFDVGSSGCCLDRPRPGIFRGALREALAEGGARQLSRATFEAGGSNKDVAGTKETSSLGEALRVAGAMRGMRSRPPADPEPETLDDERWRAGAGPTRRAPDG